MSRKLQLGTYKLDREPLFHEMKGNTGILGKSHHFIEDEVMNDNL